MPDLDGFQLADAIRRRPDLGTPMIMMLSSVGQTADAIRCRELGVASYLTKPLRQSVLLDAMLEILAARRQQTAITEPEQRFQERAHGIPRRILVAEDNAINRFVVTAILERHGHSVLVVEDGAQAVAAVGKETFDVVLMDVQMPELDGIEATRAIRAAEHGTSRHLPIIALTAHAMNGDREACLKAGMDAYLPKPIDPVALLEAIAAATTKISPVSAESVGEGGLDRVDLMSRVEGDIGLLRELLPIFQQKSSRMMAELHRALQACDAKGLERAAHSLKGSASNLGGRTVVRTAQALEAVGRDNDFVSGAVLVTRLEGEMASLERGLVELCGGPVA
jgi:CheY-like chemotaxis protein/HPt (histidine-containing phosphotransfer) domain-containing protein